MKRLFITVSILLFTCNLRAQDYQCFVPSSKQYFTNAYGYLRGMRIDSVKTFGDTTIYYPFHTLRGAYSNIVRLDSNGGSWLGKKITCLPDGTYLFDDEWDDTVVIKTQAKVGDQWIFFRDTSVHYYKATLSSIDTMTIEGSLDSVKKITLTSYSDTGIVTTDFINGMEILLSKKHGFATIFDLFTFPYYDPDTPSKSNIDYFLDLTDQYHPLSKATQEFNLIHLINPTMSQLYNWHVGDVYQYAICSLFPINMRCSMRDEYDVDSVIGINKTTAYTEYILDNKRTNLDVDRTTYPPYYYYITTLNRNISFKVLNYPLIDTLKMPEEYHQNNLYYYHPDDTLFCKRGISYEVVNDKQLGHDNLLILYSEQSNPYFIYQTGIGLLHYYYVNDASWAIGDTTLIYANINGSPCGTYSTVSVPTVPASKAAFSIYPNPSNGAIYIQIKGKTTGTAQVSVYTTTGRRVYTTSLPTAHLQHLKLNLPNGLYLLKYKSSDLSTVQQLVIHNE